MPDKLILSHKECQEAAWAMALKIGELPRPLRIYGVPRGGVPVAYLVADRTVGASVVDNPRDADVFVDDIIDSGATRSRYVGSITSPSKPFLALTDFLTIHRKPGQWVVFPWEKDEQGDKSADDIVIRLLQYIGEDPNREGLKETPRRVLHAWKEMTVGYSQDPKEILSRDFESKGYDEIIACSWVEFTSMCEHHLLPFSGVAHVAYLPDDQNARVVGLSKLARLVDCFSRRLQIQEKMTMQIAESLETILNPKGVAVVLQAKHLCMECRGVKKHRAVMTTSDMRGVFRSNPAARAEFFHLIDLARHENGK